MNVHRGVLFLVSLSCSWHQPNQGLRSGESNPVDPTSLEARSLEDLHGPAGVWAHQGSARMDSSNGDSPGPPTLLDVWLRDPERSPTESLK